MCTNLLVLAVPSFPSPALTLVHSRKIARSQPQRPTACREAAVLESGLLWLRFHAPLRRMNDPRSGSSWYSLASTALTKSANHAVSDGATVGCSFSPSQNSRTGGP